MSMIGSQSWTRRWCTQRSTSGCSKQAASSKSMLISGAEAGAGFGEGHRVDDASHTYAQHGYSEGSGVRRRQDAGRRHGNDAD